MVIKINYAIQFSSQIAPSRNLRKTTSALLTFAFFTSFPPIWCALSSAESHLHLHFHFSSLRSDRQRILRVNSGKYERNRKREGEEKIVNDLMSLIVLAGDW